MQLGVISDTHGHLKRSQETVRMLESLGVDAVLHCGDIGTPEVVALFAPWATHYVFGNCDYDQPMLQAAIAATPGGICHGMFGKIEYEGLQIALLHSHERRRFQNSIAGGAYDLVCYGHTHVAAIDRHGDTVVLNPGAVYRANPPSIAVVELPALEATIIPLS